jgi:hypothetical protein
MVYVTICLDLALFKMKEHGNECVKYNGTMPRKGEGRGFWDAEVLGIDAVKLVAQFPTFLPIAAKHHSVTVQCHTPEDLNTGSSQFVTIYFVSIQNKHGF